jgi:hypothetical protein
MTTADDELDAICAEVNAERAEPESVPLESFVLPHTPPRTLFDELPPSPRTVANLRNARRVIE